VADSKLNILIVGPLPLPPHTGGIGSLLNALSQSRPLREINADFLNTDIPDRVGMGSFFRGLTSLRFFVALLFRLLTFRYRLVHLHSSAGSSFFEKSLMLLCCRAFGVRAVIHIHSGRFPVYYEKTRWKSLVRFCLERASAVFAVTAGSKVFFETVCRTPVYQVPNCVHPCFFELRPRQDSSRDILYAGYIEQDKGIYELFSAVELMRSRGYEGRVVLAGAEKSAGSFSRAQRSIAERGLEGVELAGEVPPGVVAELCRLSGIFVLPSHVEAQPIALLEAMAAGLPVVATDVGGIPEVVTDGKNGLLVPANNPEKLAESLLRLLEDPGLRRQMGEKNRRQMLENHHADRVGEKLVGLYRSILAPGDK